MKQLFLEDLKEMTDAEVREHIAEQYSGDGQYSTASEGQILDVSKTLEAYDILFAYESVGSWGCDSSSLFIFKNKTTGVLYEMAGSHCSCYGFEGQFGLGETSAEALKKRFVEGNGYFTGGYDSDEENNKNALKEFIKTL